MTKASALKFKFQQSRLRKEFFHQSKTFIFQVFNLLS
jgi:hypothetical protein